MGWQVGVCLAASFLGNFLNQLVITGLQVTGDDKDGDA